MMMTFSAMGLLLRDTRSFKPNAWTTDILVCHSGPNRHSKLRGTLHSPHAQQVPTSSMHGLGREGQTRMSVLHRFYASTSFFTASPTCDVLAVPPRSRVWLALSATTSL